MSDPLWFLENLEENESKSDQKDFTLNLTSHQETDQKQWTPEKITNIPDDTSVQGSSKGEGNYEKLSKYEDKTPNNATHTTKVFQVDLLKDEESLKNALENSLLESIKNGQNPEIQITVDSKPNTFSSGDKVVDNSNRGDFASQDNSKIVITLNNKENGHFVGEEKKFVINNGQIEEVDKTASTNQRKVYVVLPPNENQNITPTVAGENTNTQYFEEVGNTVINLNDLLSNKENAITNQGEITANVDLSSVIDATEGTPQVKLVIKVKDERDKTESNTTTNGEGALLKSYSDNEIARLKDLLKNSATLESLDSQLESGKEVRNIPITVAPSTSSQTSTTWQTTNYTTVSDTVNSRKATDPSVDWVDKSTDSYVRRDGAQCTRTVWTSPQGRRVETKCFKDERTAPRVRRVRDLDWSPRLRYFWDDIDYEFNRIFSFF